MKRNLVLLFLLLAGQWLAAQNNPPAKTVPHRADSAPGILSFNTPGNPGIKINKDSLGTARKISGLPAGTPATAAKSQTVVNVQKTSNKMLPATNASVKKSRADSLQPPRILINDNH